MCIHVHCDTCMRYLYTAELIGIEYLYGQTGKVNLDLEDDEAADVVFDDPENEHTDDILLEDPTLLDEETPATETSVTSSAFHSAFSFGGVTSIATDGNGTRLCIFCVFLLFVSNYVVLVFR